LVSGDGYKSQVSVKNDYTGPVTIIEVDYGNLPIKCRFCQSIYHLIKYRLEITEKKVAREKKMQKIASNPTRKRGGGEEGSSATVLPLAPTACSKDNLAMFVE
jgi:hypothetical protein